MSYDGDRKTSREEELFTLPRKTTSEMKRYPYRKPTQVGKERILRRAEEPLLRNSAKCPRNFGIRGGFYGNPQRIVPGNCLSKTQLYAKSKDDVYGVTPARCRKVKRRSESPESKPR